MLPYCADRWPNMIMTDCYFLRCARYHLLSLGDVKNPEAQPWGGGVFAPFSANSQTTPRRRSRSANTLAAITEAPSTTHNRRLTSSAVCSIELATISASSASFL